MASTLLPKVKKALQLTDTTFDDELENSILSAERDLGFGNVDTVDVTDNMTETAIITFCSYMFQLMHGDVARANALKLSYDSLKTQMGTSSVYREWGNDDE